jgi:hypothetical protein
VLAQLTFQLGDAYGFHGLTIGKGDLLDKSVP